MLGKYRSTKILFGILALLCIVGCAQTVPLKVQPRGYLEQEDYSILQTEAEKLKLGRTEKMQFPPIWCYWVKEDRDFSKVASVSIPDFKLVDTNTNEERIRKMLDETADMLLGKTDRDKEVSETTTAIGYERRSHQKTSDTDKKIFNVVDRAGQADTELTLQGAVMEYKEISKGERFKTFMIGGAASAICVVEIQVIDNKTQEKVGAIQVNGYATIAGVVLGLGALAPGRAEDVVKKHIVTIMENIKKNEKKGVFHPFAKRYKEEPK